MNEEDRQNLFSELITRHQSELYSYIFAVVRNWNDADDLLQSVCLVLWRKFESFQPGTNFLHWATRTAKIVVSNFLRNKQVSVHASDELLNVLVETMMDVQSRRMDQYLEALRRCRSKLSTSDAELIDLHYADEFGSRQIAERLKRSQPSVCHSLNRIRSWLLRCIQKELAQQQHGVENRS
jgi:RNA polymerase sigma-70 factor, ECF subfamily